MDNSEDAKRAAKRVIDLLQPNTITKIVAFHSVEHPIALALTVPLTIGSPTHPSMSPERLKEEFKIAGKKILNETEILFKKVNKWIETRLIEGEDPEDYILRVVEEEGFDLVALGSKGDHSKLKEIFMGSIAQKVLNEASCDVLIVR